MTQNMNKNTEKYELAAAKSVVARDERAARREEDDFDTQVQIEELAGPDDFSY